MNRPALKFYGQPAGRVERALSKALLSSPTIETAFSILYYTCLPTFRSSGQYSCCLFFKLVVGIPWLFPLLLLRGTRYYSNEFLLGEPCLPPNQSLLNFVQHPVLLFAVLRTLPA
ncbi:hypothetical protein SUGI_1475720 [Cryptomeria japonica]|uniref:Uncharacterized protein n=1 Tax=Cryptomeria japonica TaxID=3369 RepID=A0AAD3NTQ7_CRYJA|nr:hypothetical protein SUGI_1467130 [Cryptomeria japonica]GLJ58777.1 hypothetical protein SUGI_1475720 [Cryptomeria japonica]